MLLQHLLERITEVLEQMPAVGNLDGVRRATRGPVRIRFGAIGLIISTPGWVCNQVATVVAVRSGSRSTT